MRLDVFSEMQYPKALWGEGGHEQRLIQETLEQARLADELGYGVWWQVEHHGAVEFSYSSAPELMLTAITMSKHEEPARGPRVGAGTRTVQPSDPPCPRFRVCSSASSS